MCEIILSINIIFMIQNSEFVEVSYLNKEKNSE